jgi:hypothetical protein
MQVTGMLYGARLLQFAGFPTAEVLGPDANEEQIKALLDDCGSVFVKPVFKGGVGKKGKAGLVGRASDLKSALREKERPLFRRAPMWQSARKVQWRYIRRSSPRRARSLLFHHGFDTLSRAHDDAHAPWRRRHRGT